MGSSAAGLENFAAQNGGDSHNLTKNEERGTKKSIAAAKTFNTQHCNPLPTEGNPSHFRKFRQQGAHIGLHV